MSNPITVQDATRLRSRRPDGLPIYAYARRPDQPPVTTLWVGTGCRDWPPELGHAHVHDFPLLVYVEHGGGMLQVGRRHWPIQTGDVYAIAPGEVLGVHDRSGLADAAAWAVYFAPEALGRAVRGAELAWPVHPLLAPFVGAAADGRQRLQVPEHDRAAWSERFRALDGELARRGTGYQTAVAAHLLLLLVDVTRLTGDGGDAFGVRDESLLAEVFGLIEQRFHKRVSLGEIAAAVSLTPGYVTTVVRQHTGRTVQAWITERRMVEARRYLAETDLSIATIARRVGYSDGRYFVRTFGRLHGAAPGAWRRASRVEEAPTAAVRETPA